MTNNDELAIKLKEKALLALDSWNKFLSLPDDIDLERGLSPHEVSLLSRHDAISNPANILTLLAERDADKKRIAELATEHDEFRKRLKLERSILDDADNDLETLRHRISELEARTVSVKLPKPIGPEAAPAHYWDNGESMAYADGYNKASSDAKNLCAAAGINLEVGE